MPKATRIGDLCTGHESFPPRPSISGSSDVFVNDIGSHRVGDLWAPHPHDGILISGSASVFVNDAPKGRVGDMVDCGSMVLNGSDDVEVGG